MRHVSHGVLDASADTPKTLACENHHERHHGRKPSEEERQLPADPQHGAEENDDFGAVLNDGFERFGARIAQLRDVIGDTGYQVALGAGVEIIARHQQQLVEQPRANIVHDAERDLAQKQFAHDVAERSSEHQAEHHRRYQLRLFARLPPGVDEIPENPHEIGFRARSDKESQNGEQKNCRVRPYIPEQASIGRPIAFALGIVLRCGFRTTVRAWFFASQIRLPKPSGEGYQKT